MGLHPANADTLLIRIKPEVLELVRSRPAQSRPALFIMLSNFVVAGEDSAAGDFDSESVRRFLGNPVARANAVRQLRAAVLRHGLAGTTLDIENFAPDLHANVLSFARELQQEMHAIGRLSTQAVAVSEDDDYIQRAAEVNDKLFPMLFDEHYSSGDPGPIASQRFFVTQAERFARLVDPSKLIFMVGAYGYDWNDADAVLHNRAGSGQLPGDHARGSRPRPPAAAAGSRNAQSVHPLDRRGFDRARDLVSRRDHGLQPDAGRASPRRRRPRHLAARRRGSVVVARHRCRRNAPRRRQPPSGPTRLRHRVRGDRGDPADHRLPLAGPSRGHRR